MLLVDSSPDASCRLHLQAASAIRLAPRSYTDRYRQSGNGGRKRRPARRNTRGWLLLSRRLAASWQLDVLLRAATGTNRETNKSGARRNLDRFHLQHHHGPLTVWSIFVVRPSPLLSTVTALTSRRVLDTSKRWRGLPRTSSL